MSRRMQHRDVRPQGRLNSRARNALRPALAGTGLLAVLLLLAVVFRPWGDSPAQAAPNLQADPQPAFTPEQLEYFEKKVRPVLIERCFECHSHKAKKLKSEFHLDSRDGVLKGGERGPAAVAGKPAESRLVKAISYANRDLQMPPKGKLPDDQIAALGKWVQMGMPWPAEAGPMGEAKGPKAFDLKQRMDEHWSWKGLSNPAPPAVGGDWARGEIDRFIFAKLQAAGLKPAADADRPVLIRRLYFDLIGLPPTPEQIDAFVDDRSERAVEKVVDELLQSPHFGERWGRHWLDMVRYAESRGHEFDPDAANAFEYRDYVIRALNADVPYDQFVVEHLAGDLLDKPRLHPERGFNESILGTGFWFLGEQVHSPVDIRKDETDRFDNMVDVMTKTFLGLTVACARCHDHKFDAISTKDYYALVGFLQSSDYRQVRFETLETEKRIAGELQRMRELHTPAIARAVGGALASGAGDAGRYVAAVRALLAAPTGDKPVAADILFEDFEKQTYEGWTVEGTAFGAGPVAQDEMPAYQGKVGAQGARLVNSHNVRDSKSDVIGGDNHVGRMTSRQFKIDRDYISLLIGGGAHEGKTCLQVLIDDKVVATITGRNANAMSAARIDLRKHRGATARIRIIDDHREGWGNIGVDHIVFTDQPPAGAGRAPGEWRANWSADEPAILGLAQAEKLNAARLAAWANHLAGARKNPADPLHGVAELIAGGAPASLAGRYAPPPAAGPQPSVMVDFATLDQSHWSQDGFSFGAGPIRLGQPKLSDHPDRPIDSIGFPGAAERDPVFSGLKLAPGTIVDPGVVGQRNRPGRTVRSPTFKLTTGRLYYLARGRLAVLAMVDSHRMINGPLHGAVARDINIEPAGQWRWVEHNLADYAGHRIHVEFSAVEEIDGAIARIVQVEPGQSPPTLPGNHNPLIASVYTGVARAQAAQAMEGSVRTLAGLFNQAAGKLADSALSKSDQPEQWSQLADWMVRNSSLFIAAGSPEARTLSQAAQGYTQALGPLKASVPAASRTAMAMLDGSAEDEPVLIRGGHNTPGPLVPRRMLEALGGMEKPITGPGSGRLQLARQIIDPANPYVSRVIVNRLWHHLFGRGIVPSVDNFGVLGQGPSHPELLDHMASRFIAEGWSLKKAIRTIVLSRTYRMASRTDQPVGEKDPQNLLLHRMPIKRLQGEVIRDSVLAISGRLDRTMYGPSVPNHLTEFMDGRGRPAGGPLDGNGRRSIYLAIRRNFLSPMMLAFDYPTPFSSVGQRTVSNVPAQALILMNDPFIQQQAGVWAGRVLGEKNLSVDERINLMYRQAFGRPATEAERRDAAEFLTLQAGALGLKPDQAAGAKAPWADLAHVLWNVKEFVYIP